MYDGPVTQTRPGPAIGSHRRALAGTQTMSGAFTRLVCLAVGRLLLRVGLSPTTG
jgi:hypothetical protein